MVLAGLVVAGGISDLTKPEFASATAPLCVMILLGAASVTGGRHLNKKGWQQGHDVANVMAVLPVAVLAVMLSLGAIATATQPKPPPSAPTDAYGYTAGQRQEMATAMGGGTRGTCLANAIEHAIPADQLIGAYNVQEQSFAADMTTRITRVVDASGC